MPLIVTPKQLSLRAELYHQLGALLSAGVTLFSSIESLRKRPPARSLAEPLRLIERQLEQGETFAQSLHAVSHWVPSFDISLLQAGEKSGRLDACLKVLAEYYRERAQLVRAMMSQLGYPVFLFHFAVLLGPFPQLFLTWNVLAYAVKVLGILLPVYAATLLLILACQGRNGEKWRSLIEQLCRYVPILGSARRSLALARLSLSLEALINAGVLIIDAWELAAHASGSPALRRRVLGWRSEVELGGLTPGDVVTASREFPELFASLYRTGEVSGKLDETLRRLYQHYQEEGTRQLRLLAAWAPKMVYFGVVLWIAARVLVFYTAYFKTLSDVMK